MPAPNFANRTLFHSDNLPILQGMNGETVDLIATEQRINDWMFRSSEKWHRDEDVSWVALSFSPEILSHPGVVFTTTNNIYPSCKRSEGLDGFSQMFSDPVIGRLGSRHVRAGKPDSWTTDRQAEVLYPGELSIEHLQRIDVQMEETQDRIHGIMSGLGKDVPVCYVPEVFI